MRHWKVLRLSNDGNMAVYRCKHSVSCALKIQALCALYYVLFQFQKYDVGAGTAPSSESTAHSADAPLLSALGRPRCWTQQLLQQPPARLWL